MTEDVVFASHCDCFACGQRTPTGLGLVFQSEGGTVCCRTSLDSRFQSYGGIVHGGILATIVDAAMVNLVYRRFGGQPLTCSLDARYRSSVRVGEEISVTAAVELVKYGMVWTCCRLMVGTRVCVEAKAIFKIVRP